MKITRYVPTFVDLDEPPLICKFGTLEELKTIPFVYNFTKDPNFYRFSVSDNRLMAEYIGGKKWWVIGYLDIDATNELILPKWTRPKESL